MVDFPAKIAQKWQRFFANHPDLKLLLILLAAAYAARLALAFQGGQLYWPDEVRFSVGYKSFSALLKGDFHAFSMTFLNSPPHSGFYLLSGIFGLMQQKVSHVFHKTFQEMYWVSAGLFSILSVGNILLVYWIAIKAGAARGEALIAGTAMAVSNSMFYYSRHLLPYDSSMFFALAALGLGLNVRHYRIYAICGLLIGISIWVYTGYWIFCLAVMGILALYQARSFWNCLLRGLVLGIGSLLPVYVLLLFSLINGSFRSFPLLLKFLNSATQGSAREGWTLPWEYLWHSEHAVLLIWLAGFILAVFILLKNYRVEQKYVLYWIAAVLSIYLIFVIGSTGLHKFVIYGRFARELIPFFCMIAAFSLYQFRNVLIPHRVFSTLAVLLLIIQTAFNFYPPFVQKWPREFYSQVTQIYGDVYRDVTVLGPTIKNTVKLDPDKKFLVVLNVDFLYPITGQKPGYSGKPLLREAHPLSYWPYQYEGLSPKERNILRSSDVSMKLIEVDPGASGNLP